MTNAAVVDYGLKLLPSIPIYSQLHFRARDSQDASVSSNALRSSSTTSDAATGHVCTQMHLDSRAIVCPVCDRVVPVARGNDPNLAVNAHINAGCPDPGTSTTGKAYTNTCSLQSCSKKELVPILCQTCRKSFCIRHRLEVDHQCSSLPAAPARRPAAKLAPAKPSSTPAARQNARGLEAAQMDQERRQRAQKAAQIKQDAALAASMQKSDRQGTGGNSSDNNCNIS
ncbi:hypothetical protein BASA50_003376 [Batrachochytrium salamandrivorans]|uniref:AN1-type domain-containing protein n=1 Tax=Batrachochytrium salamandrivorans TaxID=1357716 RepID=A0ABQ8FII8_9FUNG|nr:hypothetical protein BASA62_003460 [Batrachochytrium salamandrivorans]KAH6596928.1 hypothetical protein BASA61_003309 [Batrachochytrium salamandrivorans]KAH6598869.1 hypothetical protein BASA50_003376 [Batrachochytrium salamandrivorans]KAH9273700.1 hypothetical protein BASA83_004033 [Batrachochytrium salamandrivorans]KAJ1339049.1 hypothetical protein BSLG_006188 [Batrachochytrium salamandrivorans]